MTQLKAIAVRLTGRVQGVSFRAWARDEAERHGVAGWIRNEPDGDVTAHLEGAPDAVEAMCAALRKGPPAASVRNLTTEDVAPEGGTRFEIRR